MIESAVKDYIHRMKKSQRASSNIEKDFHTENILLADATYHRTILSIKIIL